MFLMFFVYGENMVEGYDLPNFGQKRLFLQKQAFPQKQVDHILKPGRSYP